jgi:hypothetical protein
MSDLTQRQKDYFRTLEKLDPSDDMRRIIEDAKEDLEETNRSGDNVIRGLTRVKGFKRND